MVCPNCQVEYDSTENTFCPNCGADRSDTDSFYVVSLGSWKYCKNSQCVEGKFSPHFSPNKILEILKKEYKQRKLEV